MQVVQTKHFTDGYLVAGGNISNTIHALHDIF